MIDPALIVTLPSSTWITRIVKQGDLSSEPTP